MAGTAPTTSATTPSRISPKQARPNMKRSTLAPLVILALSWRAWRKFMSRSMMRKPPWLNMAAKTNPGTMSRMSPTRKRRPALRL
ncbi:hypothetical protein D3C87_1834230 [compost metagenome]